MFKIDTVTTQQTYTTFPGSATLIAVAPPGGQVLTGTWLVEHSTDSGVTWSAISISPDTTNRNPNFDLDFTQYSVSFYIGSINPAGWYRITVAATYLAQV